MLNSVKEITQKISHITPDDMDTLIELHEEYLNYGDGIRPHFEKILHDPSNIALKHIQDGEITGIYIYTKGISLSGKHDELLAELTGRSKGKSVYTGDAVLVRKSYRKLGIADKLCAAALREIKRRNAELVLHELWVYPDGQIPAKKMLRVLTKHIYVEYIEDFYKDFHHYGYICPICGQDCICAAEVYLSEMPEVLP